MRLIFSMIIFILFMCCSSGGKNTADTDSFTQSEADGPLTTDESLLPDDSSLPTDTDLQLTDDSSPLTDEDSSQLSDNDAIVFGPFKGTIILASPTDTSIKAKVLSPDQSGSVFMTFGKTPGSHDRQTADTAITAGELAPLIMDGLSPDTQYYYRLFLITPDGTGCGRTDEYTFHTARPAGSTFKFTIQADSHLDENSIYDVYRRALSNVLADAPDFHIDLGDTFMCNKHSKPLDPTVQAAPDQPTVDARYEYEMNNFGIAAHSVPLFLVNGNHEGEAGYAFDDKTKNLSIWTTLARKKYFDNPAPDHFYTGDNTEEQFVGKRAAWYSWYWGDALFIVLDPYWYSTSKGGGDSWGFSLGEAQFKWLEDTLASGSAAKFKFVFIHNLVGGLDGQMRGGIEAAPFYEWGGKNEDETDVFAEKRNGWSMPLHQMLVQYGVNAVFHGHDHVYVKQDLDGIAYLELPQPSAKNSKSGANLAAEYHYVSGTILSSSGHIRVTVSPDKAVVQYIRAWLPENENSTQKNGSIDDEWIIEAK